MAKPSPSSTIMDMPDQTTAVPTTSRVGSQPSTMTSLANLAKLLPTGTVLAFQALSPSFSNRGACYTSNEYLSAVLLFVCAVTCIVFTFTDSLRGSDGKLYFGIATKKGIYVFNSDGDVDVVFGDLSKYKITPLDCVHAFFGVFVFLSVAFGDNNIQNCFFGGAGASATEILKNLPLGVGLFSSLIFLLFPTTRKGIGYTDTTSSLSS